MPGSLAEELPLSSDRPLTPLVVDLDGTLIRSDLLLESFFALASSSIWRASKALCHLRRGRAAFKAELALQTPLSYEQLPYNAEVLAWLKAEHGKGRSLYLASASHEKYVKEIAAFLGIFSGTFASTATENLKGQAKAARLCQAFGRRGFDYAGNEKADIAVWKEAKHVIVVNAAGSLQRLVQERFPTAEILSPLSMNWKDLRWALRPHQWLKNLLIFVPAFMAHHFNVESGWLCFLAFLSFSFCSSSVYLLNDLLDLRHDREHYAKRHRPFAAGTIPLQLGLALIALSLTLSLAIASVLPWKFFLALSSYYILTVVYSAYLKRKMILDVVTLALLYCVRLVAGAAVVAVPLSPWLLSFSVFLFLCLALIKRCSEIIAHNDRSSGDPQGRGYRLADLSILECMSSSSGYVAALTSGLYISSPTVAQLYSHFERLWLIPVILLFWISRMLILTHRGEMHDDPVFFAVRDRASLCCGGLLILVVLASI